MAKKKNKPALPEVTKKVPFSNEVALPVVIPSRQPQVGRAQKIKSSEFRKKFGL